MNPSETITVADGYRAMFKFLEAFWERGSKSSDDIADLLSMLDYSHWGENPEESADPAMWPDWLNAVRAIRR